MGDNLKEMKRRHREAPERGFAMNNDEPFHIWLRDEIDEGFFSGMPQDLSQASEKDLERVCEAWLKAEAVERELARSGLSEPSEKLH